MLSANRAGLVIALIATLTCAGCSKPTSEIQREASVAAYPVKINAPKNSTPPDQEARALFDGTCSTCHGKTGEGDGAGAASLNPKPRNFTDGAWQSATDDAAVAKAIVKGGGAVGKSALMPPNPALENKPKVVEELIKIIRALNKGGAAPALGAPAPAASDSAQPAASATHEVSATTSRATPKQATTAASGTPVGAALSPNH